MTKSILDGKKILAVDDEPDILDVLEEEILSVAPQCKIEKATTYYDAKQRLTSQTYDLVILDIMGIRASISSIYLPNKISRWPCSRRMPLIRNR